jgi:hypothetical protein
MSAGTMPPAPGAPVPAAEVAVFRTWLERGAPSDGCGSNAGGTAGASAAGGASSTPTGGVATAARGGGAGNAPVVVCTSGSLWAGDDDVDGLDEEGPWMNPGEPCIRCHLDEEDEPLIQLGGTVFPTFNEPDSCFGVDGRTSDAEVVITDDSGAVFRLPLERTGNFSLPEDARQVRFPIRAKVVANGRERVMAGAQTSGDCNDCHSEQGNHGAPGRIALP